VRSAGCPAAGPASWSTSGTLEHWLAVAGSVDGFAGFAIGRSIWEDPITSHNNEHATEDATTGLIAERYLDFARQYCAASAAAAPSGPG